MDEKSLSGRDICTKFTTLALRKAGWDENETSQIREEVSFTKRRIIVPSPSSSSDSEVVGDLPSFSWS